MNVSRFMNLAAIFSLDLESQFKFTKCFPQGTSTVAVKTLKESASEKEKKDLLAELEVMKMLRTHPNVVRLLGCCTTGSDKGEIVQGND